LPKNGSNPLEEAIDREKQEFKAYLKDEMHESKGNTWQFLEKEGKKSLRD
jgi:hypothetical protein